MAEDGKKTGAETPDQAATGAAKSELPTVDSPSISPANDENAAAEPETAAGALPSTAIVPFTGLVSDSPIAPEPTRKSFRMRARHRVMAALAASVVFAGVAGVLTGFAASGAFKTPEAPKVDTAALEERKALQQSVAQLNKEIGTLKANLQAANKAANTQIARLTERLNREAAEVTGSIAAPQTTAPAAVAAPAEQTTAVTPLPTPRPVRTAAIEPRRLSVVNDWTIRETRNGYVYVQNHGEIYEVVPGAALPGLGPVERIQRRDGRWMVVTPRGLIVSARDRAYFE